MLYDSETNSLKIIDFESALRFRNAERMNGQAGNIYYMAPEMLEGSSYNEKVDIWSCGVILYVMLSGCPPFEARRQKELTDKIKMHIVKFKGRSKIK